MEDKCYIPCAVKAGVTTPSAILPTELAVLLVYDLTCFTASIACDAACCTILSQRF